MFRDRGLVSLILNGSWFLPLVFDSNSRGKPQMTFEKGVLTAFQAQLYFHAPVLMNREIGAKKLNIFLNAMNSTLAEIAFQLVQKALDVLTKLCLLGPLPLVIEPCIWFNRAVIQFQILLQRMDVFVSFKQNKSLFKSGLPLAGPHGVDETARDHSPELDEEFRFICYSIVEKVSKLVSNNLLQTLYEE